MLFLGTRPLQHYSKLFKEKGWGHEYFFFGLSARWHILVKLEVDCSKTLLPQLYYGHWKSAWNAGYSEVEIVVRGEFTARERSYTSTKHARITADTISTPLRFGTYKETEPGLAVSVHEGTQVFNSLVTIVSLKRASGNVNFFDGQQVCSVAWDGVNVSSPRCLSQKWNQSTTTVVGNAALSLLPNRITFQEPSWLCPQFANSSHRTWTLSFIGSLRCSCVSGWTRTR